MSSPMEMIILRTDNNKDIVVSRALLSHASAFFMDMFQFPQPLATEPTDLETPVVPVAEDSDTWSALLSWIDPQQITTFELTSLSLIVDPVDKYVMEGIKHSLIAFLHTRPADDTDALRLFALSVRLGDNSLAKKFAKSAASHEIHDLHLFPEFYLVPFSAISALDSYGKDILLAAGNAFDRRDRGGHVFKVAQTVNSSWVEGSWKDKQHPDCGRSKVGGKGSVSYRDWFASYVDKLQLVVQREKFPKQALQTIPTSCYTRLRPAKNCEICGERLNENLLRFNELMVEKIELDEHNVSVPDFV